MPSSQHSMFHALIPGSPLLLDTYAGLCHLLKIFYPSISICCAHSSCCCNATFGALGSIHSKKGNTSCLPLLPSAVVSYVPIPSSILSSKSYYSRSKQEYIYLSLEQCIGIAPLLLMLIFSQCKRTVLFTFKQKYILLTCFQKCGYDSNGAVHSPSSILIWLQGM